MNAAMAMGQGRFSRRSLRNTCEEVAPADVLHREEVVAVDVAEVVDLHDVRVVEQRADARLAHEHLDEVGGLAELLEDPLDDERAPKPFGARHDGAKHLRHAPDGDPVEQDVAPEPLGLHRFALGRPLHIEPYRPERART